MSDNERNEEELSPAEALKKAQEEALRAEQAEEGAEQE